MSTMNLQQLKSQANLDQKLLIDKVENLVRLEYDLDNLKKEIHSELKDKIFNQVYKVLEGYGIVNRPNSFFKEYSMSDVYHIKELCYKIGEAVRLECKNDKEIKSSDII